VQWGRVELVPSLLLHIRVGRWGEPLLELLPGDLLLRVQLLIELMRPLQHVPKIPLVGSSTRRFSPNYSPHSTPHIPALSDFTILPQKDTHRRIRTSRTTQHPQTGQTEQTEPASYYPVGDAS
jgi:hypothetical protein